MKWSRIAAAIATASVVAVSTCVVGSSPVAAQSGGGTEGPGLTAVHVVMDISGSMADQDGSGRTKLNGAKSAVTALLDGLYGTDTPVALRTYPSRGDCSTGQLNVDFTRDYQTIDREARSLAADGDTPTAEALTAAAADFRDAGYGGPGRNSGLVIVLVSDGESTCADPCEAAVELNRQGFDVTVNTIGFNISEDGASELECIADTTDGEYRDVDDADELATSIVELTTSALAIDVDAPAVWQTSVGRGSNAKVPFSVTVRNTSANTAQRVRAQVRVVSERRPFVARPTRSLGNIEAQSTAPSGAPIVWSFTPPLDFEDVDVTFEVTATAQNAESVTEQFTIQLRGRIDLADAGPVLQGKDNVVVLGDSYSSGEGAGDYIAGTDVETNTCHRSERTYGLDLFSREILACSGAVTLNFREAQMTRESDPMLGGASQFEQLSSLDDPPDLVLLTLGGNDVGFKDIIVTCIAGIDACHDDRTIVEVACDSIDPSRDVTDDVQERAAELRELIAAEPVYSYYQAIYPVNLNGDECFEDLGTYGDEKVADAAAVVPDLVSIYLGIDNIVNSAGSVDARNGEIAPIVVLGYPNPVPDVTRYEQVIDLCPGFMEYDEWRWVSAELVPAINGGVASAVSQAESLGVPIRFVPQSEAAFAPSHTICDDDTYINQLDLSALAATGAKKVLDLVRFRWPIAHFLSDALDAEARSLAESYHPNASGYRAMTAALVEWSQSADGQRDIERARPSVRVEDPPPRTGPPLRVTEADPGSLVRGAANPVEVPGLLPGAPLTVTLESRRQVVASTTVDDDGVGRFDVVVPAGLPIGQHRLTWSSINSDGAAQSVAVDLDVIEAESAWERWSVLVALAALLLALVIGLALRVTSRRGERAARLDATAHM